MSIKDQKFGDQIVAITRDQNLSDVQKRVAAGKALREAVERLKGEGKSNAEVADLTGMRESRVRELAKSYEMHEHSIIWFPGIYSGREGDYAKLVIQTSTEELVALVQKRAKEDGEWAIENNVVGDNEDKMRRMMAFVSDQTNIEQCVAHIVKEGRETEATVDWVCRDLANASKVMIK